MRVRPHIPKRPMTLPLHTNLPQHTSQHLPHMKHQSLHMKPQLHMKPLHLLMKPLLHMNQLHTVPTSQNLTTHPHTHLHTVPTSQNL